MKITKTQSFEGVRVTTDEEIYNEYTRYSADCWYVTMGESEEPVYECSELERLYQERTKER